jgi:pimeloyl-ACP methyl ester carboxylesterase
MTLNALQLWRKAIPFVISVVCVVPWIGARAQSMRECALILTFALAIAFLYVILNIPGPRWEQEMETHVRAQIRSNLITLVPENLYVTSAEREQLANSEIFKELTGIFWEEIDHNKILRSHKQHFYSNGFAYSTAVDGFLSCIVFGVCYAIAWMILKDIKLLFSAVGLIVVGVICRWLAIPTSRQRHLALSREQLALLKTERGQFIADRFRLIVLKWRAQGRPGVSAPSSPPKRAILWKEGFAGIFVVIAFSALALMSQGWFGPGPGVRLATEVKSGYVSEGAHNKFAAVVFVHGIFGTKEDTWLGRGRSDTFPQLLSNDPELKDRVDVFAFEYFTPKFGAAPSIVDLDDQLRGALDDHHLFENHQKIVFLAHSMGGIVVRHFLLNHQDRIESVPMVFFYATPTNGSEMASVGQLVSINPQLRGMVPIEGNDLLQSIQSGWLNSDKAKFIASHCAVEELPTFGITIVTRSSATSLCNRPLDPFSANHMDIVKPTDREDSRYTRFVSALQKEVLTSNSSPTPRIPSPGTPRTKSEIAKREEANPEIENFEFEIETRADATTAALDRLATMTWLDGDSNTGNGTSLRFAGSALSGVLLGLDHPRNGIPKFKDMAYLPLMLEFRQRVPEYPRVRIEQSTEAYKRIKKFCESQPRYEDVDRRLSRVALREAIKRLRDDVSALQVTK